MAILEACEPKEADDVMASLGLKMGSRKKIAQALRVRSATAKSATIAQFNAQGGVPRDFECPIR